MASDKRYTFKVFDKDENYITTWNDATFPGFQMNINSGLGELILSLGRSFGDFDEGGSVKVTNLVKIFVSDVDAVEQLLYFGFISGYRAFASGDEEGVEVHCLGVLGSYAHLLYKNSATVTLAHSAVDPNAIAKDIVDRVQAEYADDPLANYLTYTAASVPATSTTVSYTFTSSMALAALKKSISLAPSDWSFFVGADNVLFWDQNSTTADHSFTYKKDVARIEVFKNMESIRNQILFWNGRASNDAQVISKDYLDTASKDEFGYRWENIIDGRITVETTADILGEGFRDSRKNIDIRTTLEISDNNLDNKKGYDIESVFPGQTCQVRGLPETTSSTLSNNMLIVGVSYKPDSILLEVESNREAALRDTNKLENSLTDQTYDVGQPAHT